MTIEAKHVRLFGIAWSVIAVPLALLWFYEPGSTVAHPTYTWVFPLLLPFCVCGALLTILERLGVVQFHYTEEDKRRFHYRVAKTLAKREREGGFPFSCRYFENYGLSRNLSHDPRLPGRDLSWTYQWLWWAFGWIRIGWEQIAALSILIIAYVVCRYTLALRFNPAAGNFYSPAFLLPGLLSLVFASPKRRKYCRIGVVVASVFAGASCVAGAWLLTTERSLARDMYGFYDFLGVMGIASLLGSLAIVIGFVAGLGARDEAK